MEHNFILFHLYIQKDKKKRIYKQQGSFDDHFRINTTTHTHILINTDTVEQLIFARVFLYFGKLYEQLGLAIYVRVICQCSTAFVFEFEKKNEKKKQTTSKTLLLRGY